MAPQQNITPYVMPSSGQVSNPFEGVQIHPNMMPYLMPPTPTPTLDVVFIFLNLCPYNVLIVCT